ncbi:MAG: hypothetical protein JRI68_13290 [Deltaproteobacteria bacterium]|nr:hypothetical protein [Deltaproteobacteria bacterium]
MTRATERKSLPSDRLFELRGSAEQQAQAQGEVLRPLLDRCFAGLASLPVGPAWLPGWLRNGAIEPLLRALGAAHLSWHRRALADHEGGLWLRRHEALAAGLGIPLATLYGFAAFELESSILGFSLACSALGFGRAQTADGATRLAYNHDFPPAFAPFVRLRRSLMSEPIGGPVLRSTLCLTYPMMVGAIAGVNERGLGLTINQAYATDLRRRRPSLLATLLVQDCLERCDSVAEAVERALSTPVANGALISMVDAAGDRAVVELSGTAARVRRPEPHELMFSFNNYRIPELQEREVPLGAVTTLPVAGYDVHECNLTRARRLGELFDPARRYADRDITALLGDHDGGDGDMTTICRHDDPLNETILSAIIAPRERTIRVLFGKACEGQSVTYGLDPSPRRRRELPAHRSQIDDGVIVHHHEGPLLEA